MPSIASDGQSDPVAALAVTLIQSGSSIGDHGIDG
jgi:hypothetical protein